MSNYLSLPEDFDKILAKLYIAGYSDSTRRASGQSAAVHDAKKKLLHALDSDDWVKIQRRVEDLDPEQSDDLKIRTRDYYSEVVILPSERPF